MTRVWHKTIPPKKAQEIAHLYTGVWLPQLDRCWESEDGYCVMSRAIRTAWGVVEHVTIENMAGSTDVPWAVKQEIKDTLFGFNRIAVEVFPTKKNLVDVCNVYHLWVLPKDFKLPFGIHPTRDPLCEPVERGYDFNLDEVRAWNENPLREVTIGSRELTLEQQERVEQLKEKISGREKEIHTLWAPEL